MTDKKPELSDAMKKKLEPRKFIKNPILGDKEYYLETKILKGKGLFLHASSLDFIHPFTENKIVISKELPKKFTTIFPDF